MSCLRNIGGIITMKILNLYSGIGGNRTLWDKSHQITAIEYNYDIAQIYKQRFPDDEIIVTDAKNYLLHNFQNYDFIWASPPCQTHSQLNFIHQHPEHPNYQPKYIDFSLWEIIYFLQAYTKHTKIKWLVENTKTWYRPIIKPNNQIGRHYLWSNFDIPNIYNYDKHIDFTKLTIKHFSQIHGVSIEFFKEFNSKKTLQILRNCVDKQIGKHIIQQVDNPITQSQLEAFI